MITVSHLTKYYGEFLAVDDLSFEIGEGHVYGFLGPNGAGKSTTMNIMTGCLSATAGSVVIDGHDIYEEPEAAKRCIGYLPEQPPLYMNDTVLEYLRFVGEAKGLRGAVLREQLETVMEQTDITHVRSRKIASLSKGYRQRVGIAQALLGNPGVIILDEPTVGLDPLQIIEIRDLIRTLGRTHTVIFSSHILSEVQALCDRILIINCGKLTAFDEPDKLEKLRSGRSEILITAEGSEAEIRNTLEALPGVTGLTCQGEGILHFTVQTDAADPSGVSRAIFGAFAEKGIALSELSVKKASLEDVFLELTEETSAEKEEEAE